MLLCYALTAYAEVVLTVCPLRCQTSSDWIELDSSNGIDKSHYQSAQKNGMEHVGCRSILYCKISTA